jgi:phosphoglycerate dehydrogenase-like enzyme
MTRVLFYEPSYRRVAERLTAISGIDVLLMDRDGKISSGGEQVAIDAAKPEVGWASNDLFGGPIRDYMVALLKSPSLLWMQSGAAGFDNPVFAQLVAKGARLTTNHSQAIGMAEYVLANVLDHFQRGPERREAQRQREWARLAYREIQGTNWLIVGFGAIGQEVARRARPFGAHITGVRRSTGSHALADALISPDDLRSALPSADVVVLCLPLNRQTEGMVNEDFLANMSKTSVLVNIGRGGLVDEKALLRSLDAGRPEHAILDVFHIEPLPSDSPFWTHKHVTLTGHASAIGSGLTRRTDELFLENLRRFLRGEALLNEADPKEIATG